MKAQVNYTEAQTAEMVAEYQANSTKETVKALAEKLGKSEKSVIAKLAREGVYVKQVRAVKGGNVQKAHLVQAISKMVGFSVDSLEKATKEDLVRVAVAMAKAQKAAEANQEVA